LAKTRQILILTLLTLMMIAALPTFVGAAQPEWQADPLFRVKASNVDPYSIGANNPYYAPLDIREAYKIPLTGDSGTIAIIDAYDNPKVTADLATFCSVFTWPSANLEVHKMSQTILPNAGWALESDLDVQWAHAVAPHAKLLLVEAKSASIVDLISAVDYANSRTDVVAISMSWGANENTGQLAYDSHFTANGKVYFASSGDVGGVVSWPSSSPNVVSVGGTKLTMTTDGYIETAWTDGGGGVSTIETVPNYQIGVTDTYSQGKRATPDVSYNADPSTGFLVYDSYGYNGGRGWFIVGGTSAGAPQWAAISTFDKSATNANFYTNYNYGTTFSDITSGSNKYSAVVGYDLATGIGSPLGVNFGAPAAPDFIISANPTLTIPYSSQGTSTITIGSVGGFSDTVQLVATGISGVSVNPSSIQGSGTATLTIPAGTPLGSYSVVVTGTDTNNPAIPPHSVTINVQVIPPSDYSLSASPTSLSVQTGKSGTDRITVSPLNGYKGTVALSASGAPTGVTYRFNTNPVSITSSAVVSTLTINVPRGTHTGTYTITVTGSDTSGLSHQTTISLSIPR
jgi:hypothetical protein